MPCLFHSSMPLRFCDYSLLSNHGFYRSCTDIQVQFQRSCSTEAHEDKDPRIFLRIQVIIEPSTAILKTEVTLNFSVVDSNATGKAGS